MAGARLPPRLPLSAAGPRLPPPAAGPAAPLAAGPVAPPAGGGTGPPAAGRHGEIKQRGERKGEGEEATPAAGIQRKGGLAARGEGGEVAGRAPAADADLARSPMPGGAQEAAPRARGRTCGAGEEPARMDGGRGKVSLEKEEGSERCGGRP